MTGNSGEIEVDQLTSLPEIEQALAHLHALATSIDSKLDGLLGRKTELNKRLESLSTLIPQIQLHEEEANRLASTVDFTCSIAEHVSSRVRELDLAQSNVEKVLQRIEDIIDLKSCADGVQEALDSGAYEIAARHVNRYLSVDAQVLSSAADEQIETQELEDGEVLVSKPANTVTLLQNAQKQLVNITIHGFETASQANNMTDVMRYFQIFPLINMHREGITYYTQYLCTLIRRENEAVFSQLQQRQPDNFISETITALYSNIADYLEQLAPVIDKHYGTGWVIEFILALHTEGEILGSRLIESWKESHQFSRKVAEITALMGYSQKHGGSTRYADTEQNDPRLLDPLLDQVTMLISRSDRYCRFIAKRAKTEHDFGVPEWAQTAYVKLCSLNELARKVQELAGYYILLEEAYMKRSVAKAVALDSFDSEAHSFSFVDDTFYVLKRCTRRSLGTTEANVLCACLNHASAVLTSDYRKHIDSLLKSGYQSLSTDFKDIVAQRLTDTKGRKDHYIAAMNALDTSHSYTLTLMSTLEQDCGQLFPQVTEKDRYKIESCLVDLVSTSSTFKHALQSALEQHCNNLIRPRIRTVISGLLKTNYTLDESLYSAAEEDAEAFVFALCSEIENSLKFVKDLASEPVFDELVSLVAQCVTSEMESTIFQLSFNQLGAMRIHSEVHKLSTFVFTLSKKSLRDKFSRLNQICDLLGLEKVSDFPSYWSTNVSWRLTPSEVRRTLGLRVDFRGDEIKRLKV